VRTSRRFQLRLADRLAQELEDFAARHDLGLCASIRALVELGLKADLTSFIADGGPRDSPAALAALTASEHAVLMVASVLPEGERRMRSLAERATEAAGERLALFQPTSQSDEERA
jgi:hypothetical protein